MKTRYLSSAAAVLALALTQTSGAGVLTLSNITSGGTISSVSIDSMGNVTVTGSGSNAPTVTTTVTPTVTTTVTTTPTVPGNCPAVAVTNYNVAWANLPSTVFKIKKDEIAALKFTADGPNYNRSGIVSWTTSNFITRSDVIVNISKCPGDFTLPVAASESFCRGEGQENTLSFTQNSGLLNTYSCVLGAGEYYINIRNGANTGGLLEQAITVRDTCPIGATCGTAVTFR